MFAFCPPIHSFSKPTTDQWRNYGGGGLGSHAPHSHHGPHLTFDCAPFIAIPSSCPPDECLPPPLCPPPPLKIKPQLRHCPILVSLNPPLLSSVWIILIRIVSLPLFCRRVVSHELQTFTRCRGNNFRRQPGDGQVPVRHGVGLGHHPVGSRVFDFPLFSGGNIVKVVCRFEPEMSSTHVVNFDPLTFYDRPVGVGHGPVSHQHGFWFYHVDAVEV